MISASEIQAVLLGSGGFVGTCMAGVGAYRLFAAAAHGMMRVPTSLEKGAISLERVMLALETQNAVAEHVMELKALLMTTREDILKIGSERELIGRELRLMSRKFEGFTAYGKDE